MIIIDFTTKSEIMPEYIVDVYGNKRLYDQNGELHSYNDLPAVVLTKGKGWYKHGKRHRNNDLPAIIRPNGSTEYWVDGKRIK